MAPSPENDNAPKAPDKNEKCKEESHSETRLTETENATTGPENKEASVSRLDDGELKALLDEAITYKSPKDRLGKSQLFQNLLAKAEEDDRKARATSASGSELVRHYNRSATRRNRHCKEPSSIAEKLTHGGSLNNLAKEKLFQTVVNNPLYEPPKTVSARQRQGGSLPCNVNAGLTPSFEFYQEARKVKENQQVEYTAINMESESLLEHDSLNQDYTEQEMEVQPKFSRQYTSRATIEINPKSSCGPNTSSNVDDAVMVSALERCEKPVEVENFKPSEPTFPSNTLYPTNYTLLNVPNTNWIYKKPMEEKKVDENGNALGQGSSDSKKNKKKKLQTDKNVRVLEGKDVEGHRSDIIHDLDKLIEYIGGSNKSTTTGKTKGGNVHKTKLNKQHGSNEEKGGTTKKQRTRAKSKGGENLQKSSSMEEISSTKLEDFDFAQETDGAKVPLRNTKSNAERPRERRSWGNSETSMEFEQIQNLQIYPNASAENLETADFRVVTKKKKSKKRRNSLNGRRQTFGHESAEGDFGRRLSPEPRKSACSVPQSEKSNDSSDEDRDSVRSLPVTSDRMNVKGDDDLNFPISYADIARNNSMQDRPRWNRPPSERKPLTEKVPQKNSTVVGSGAELTTNSVIEEADAKIEAVEKVKKQASTNYTPPKNIVVNQVTPLPEKVKQQNIQNVKNMPPDSLNSLQSWPTITNNNKTDNKILQNDKVMNKNNPNMTKQKNFTNVKNMRNMQNNNFVSSNKQEKGQIQTGSNSNVNVKNNLNTEAMQMIRNSSEMMNNASNLPHNIPDVQTIEKMHFKQLQQNIYPHATPPQEVVYNHVPPQPQSNNPHQNLQSPPQNNLQNSRSHDQNPHYPQLHPKNVPMQSPNHPQLSPHTVQSPPHNCPQNIQSPSQNPNHNPHNVKPHHHMQNPQKFYPIPQNIQVSTHNPQHFHAVHARNMHALPQNLQSPHAIQILPHGVQATPPQNVPLTSQNILTPQKVQLPSQNIHLTPQNINVQSSPRSIQSPPQNITPVPVSQNVSFSHQNVQFVPSPTIQSQGVQSPPGQGTRSLGGSEGGKRGHGGNSTASAAIVCTSSSTTATAIATTMTADPVLPNTVNENCDSVRTSTRPAVVILSGEAKEVSGLTFGFEINEQLLSDDVCESFTARFLVPDIYRNQNHEKIVDFIGLAWDDVVKQIDGKVKYYSDQL